jgi:hypothetical protein
VCTYGAQLSEVANDPDVGGCTIRSYNQQNGYTHGWSPHCHELLEVHDVSEDEAPDSGTARRERVSCFVLCVCCGDLRMKT